MAGEPSMAGELARAVARDGRIAVWGAPRAVGEWERALRSEGCDVLAFEETAVVVSKGLVAPDFGPV
jgi:hypothetical protein